MTLTQAHHYLQMLPSNAASEILSRHKVSGGLALINSKIMETDNSIVRERWVEIRKDFHKLITDNSVKN